MQLDWEKMFKRYVFDDVRTPYFTRAERLTQTQARYELFVYTIFLGMLFAVLSVASLSPDLPHRGAPGVSAYALSVVLAAVAFGVARHPWAAAYCASAPLAALSLFPHLRVPSEPRHRRQGPPDRRCAGVVAL